MKTIKYAIGLLLTGLMISNLCPGQANEDSLLATRAYSALRKANVMNGITTGLGIASNIEMLAIGGFPLEVDDGLNPGLNLSHMVLGVGRFTTSIFPPLGVRKARKILEPWRDSPEMAPSCKKLFANLDAAQVLSAAAPVLCFAGGVMMFVASTSTEYHYEYNAFTSEYTTLGRPGLKTAGWICVGAGLAASFSSAILVSAAKKDLAGKIGTFKLAAGPASLGIQYNLPE